MAVVFVKDVVKSFGDTKALGGVSLQIEEGEVFGLLGSNGAGKSTLMNIIFGFEKPDSGYITMLGEQKLTNEVKQKLALVPQNTAFYDDFSVEKNLRFFASLYGISGKVLDDRIKFLLDWLKLKDFKKSKARNLSGGYQRLLNIAISVVHDPELIFFDEPTVGLDPKMRQMFWDKIEELNKKGKTIVITTHYMDEAEALCHRIALLKKGKLLSIGKPSELITQYGGIKVVIYKLAQNLKQEDFENIKSALKQKDLVLEGNTLFIPFPQEHSIEKISALTEWLLKKGYTIVSSSIKEPDLEDVFLNLTEK